MQKKNDLVLVDEKYLENKIYIIRGQKVMLDRDLAEIYGYTTKYFNRQVKNNIEKFAKDFMFQLTEEEVARLSWCSFCTTISRSKKSTTIDVEQPYSSRCQNGTLKEGTYLESLRCKNCTLKDDECEESSRSKKSTLNDCNLSSSLRCQNGTLKENEHEDSLRSQIVTLNSKNNLRGMHYKYRPYVFTESGIYMLMTVLKGPLATKQSISLIRLFRSMKDYLIENKDLLPSKELELRTTLLEKNVDDINNHLDTVDNSLTKVMDYFEDKESYKHFLILDGKKLEADVTYKNIFKLAKKSIIYIDNYIGLKTLELLSYARNNVSITLISDNKARPPINNNIVNDFISQNKSNPLALLKANKTHDRYIIIDFDTPKEIIFHCGASLKDSGNKITTIQKIEDPSIYNKTIKKLLKNDYLKL